MRLQLRTYQYGENYGIYKGLGIELLHPDASDEEQELDEDMGGAEAWIEAEDRMEMLSRAYNLLHHIFLGAIWVGGDDTYFDYFPDLFYVADQLSQHLADENLNEQLLLTRQWAVSVNYWELEPETIDGLDLVATRNVRLGEIAQEARELRAKVMWGHE